MRIIDRCRQGRRSYVLFWVRTHPLFRSWVRIGIGPTQLLRWVVYYWVCIQHDIDKSQISLIELCKTLRTNSGLRAINSCLHLFWPQLCNRNIISPADCGVWTHPHLYTDLRPWVSLAEEDIWNYARLVFDASMLSISPLDTVYLTLLPVSSLLQVNSALHPSGVA